VKNVWDVNCISLFIDGLKHFFAPLNIKDFMLEMKPRKHERLYAELSVTVVRLS